MFLPSPCVLPCEAEKPFGSMKPAGAERHVSAVRSLWLRVKVGARIVSAIGSQIGDFLSFGKSERLYGSEKNLAIVSSGKSECGKKKGAEGGFKNPIVLVGVVKWVGYRKDI